MSTCGGLGDLADVCQYQRFGTMYDPGRSGFPIAGSKHAPIPSAAFSALRLDSTTRYLRTDFGRVCATLLLCHGLRRRAARSSIRWVDVSDIYWGSRRSVSGGGVGLGAFNYWDFLSASLKSYGAERDRRKACRPRK